MTENIAIRVWLLTNLIFGIGLSIYSLDARGILVVVVTLVASFPALILFAFAFLIFSLRKASKYITYTILFALVPTSVFVCCVLVGFLYEDRLYVVWDELFYTKFELGAIVSGYLSIIICRKHINNYIKNYNEEETDIFLHEK